MSDLFDFSLPPRDRGGKTYQREFDYARLNGQQRAVWHAVKDGRWRSLSEIALHADAPEASASARLRDFRKMGLRVDRKRIIGGLFLYRLVLAEGEGTSAGNNAAPNSKG